MVNDALLDLIIEFLSSKECAEDMLYYGTPTAWKKFRGEGWWTLSETFLCPIFRSDHFFPIVIRTGDGREEYIPANDKRHPEHELYEICQIIEELRSDNDE